MADADQYAVIPCTWLMPTFARRLLDLLEGAHFAGYRKVAVVGDSTMTYGSRPLFARGSRDGVGWASAADHSLPESPKR